MLTTSQMITVSFEKQMDQILGNDREIGVILDRYLESGSPRSFHSWGMNQADYREFRERAYAHTQINGFDLRFRDVMNKWVKEQITAATQPLPYFDQDVDFDQWFDSFYGV